MQREFREVMKRFESIPQVRPLIRTVLAGVGLLEPARRVRERIDVVRWLPTNTRYRWSSREDSATVPPASLIGLATGNPSVAWYVESGRRAVASLRDALARQNLTIGPGRRVLDFGCGCGRVVRHWAQTGAEIHGSDVNPRLTSWCRRALPFAQFRTNGAAPPLAYGDDFFDVVYALSVFTHMPEALQMRWIEELTRVLRPSGILIITTHGEAYMPALNAHEQRQFRAGCLVTKGADAPGTNRYGAYAPESFVRTKLAGSLRLLEFTSQGAIGNPHQDLAVLQKPRRSRYAGLPDGPH